MSSSATEAVRPEQLQFLTGTAASMVDDGTLTRSEAA
jgi:hypothetical protein